MAAESYSDLFIKITDATTAVENKNQDKAKELIAEIQDNFESKITMIQGRKKSCGSGYKGR